MIISLIVAMDEQGGIGIKGALPWRLSSDLQRFKALTMGHHLVMGRKTYESIGRPLPGRITLIVTHNPTYQAEGCQVVHSLDEALDIARSADEEEAFIAGGGEIFAQALPRAGRIYLTLVHTRLDCDTFFPPMQWDQWKITAQDRLPADAKNEFPSTYYLLERSQGE